MRKIIVTGVVTLIFAYHSFAQKDSAVKAKQVIKLEQALMDALPGDTALWSKYLDPQWYIVTEDGSGFNKSEFLKGFGPFPKGYSGSIKVINPVLTFHDKIAVIHYVADEHEVVFGQQLHTTYGTVNTYYKTDTSWMMIGSQVFEIPQLPVALKIPQQVLQQYVGTYTLSDRTAVVTVSNDTLYIQKGNAAPEVLLAETANIFFRKSDTRGRKIFIKNDKGEVLMLERRNGNDLAWKRTK